MLYEESPVLPHRPMRLKFSDDIPLERNNSLHIPPLAASHSILHSSPRPSDSILHSTPRASDSLLPSSRKYELEGSSRKYEGVIVKSSDRIEDDGGLTVKEKRLSYREKFNDSIANNMLINNIVQAGKDLSKRMTFYEIESTL